jgi:hypothetical protein
VSWRSAGPSSGGVIWGPRAGVGIRADSTYFPSGFGVTPQQTKQLRVRTRTISKVDQKRHASTDKVRALPTLLFASDFLGGLP